MENTIKVVDDVTVVYLKGKLDASTSATMEQSLSSVLMTGSSKLILDFSELTYISSAGLRILLKTAKQMQSSKGIFLLCSMKDFIREVFDVSGFSGILTIEDNCDNALAKCK